MGTLVLGRVVAAVISLSGLGLCIGGIILRSIDMGGVGATVVMAGRMIVAMVKKLE